MARRKKIEETQQEMESQDNIGFGAGQVSINSEDSVKDETIVTQISMNHIAQAAFNELGKMNAYPSKPLDEFTLKEHRQAIAHLKSVIRKQMEGDTFEVNPAYTSLLCMLALCYTSNFDLNKYFNVKIS